MATVAPQPPRNAVWRRAGVWQLLLVALLAEIGYAVMNISTMPIYLSRAPGAPGKLIAEGRGLGESVIGWIVVAFLFSEAIFKSPAGTLADRVGPRKLMLIGPCVTVFTSVATLFIPINFGAWEVIALALLRIGDGIGAAMLWPALFSRMGHLVEDAQRQEAMSFLNLCYLVGIALALPIGGIVNDLTGHTYASLMLTTVLFACVAFAVWRYVPTEEPDGHHEPVPEAHSGPGFGEFVLSLKEIPAYLTLAAITFMGIGFPMVIVKPFANAEFGLSETAFGALVFPAAIAMAAFSAPLSRLGEKLGRARAVHLGLALCAGGLLFVNLGALVPFFHSAWALALGGIPIGVGFLLTIPAWMAAVSDIDPERRGSNVGAVMTAQGVGAIIGAPIGAALYEKLPVHDVTLAHYSPFIGCFACVAAGWLLSMKLLHAGPAQTEATAIDGVDTAA